MMVNSGVLGCFVQSMRCGDGFCMDMEIVQISKAVDAVMALNDAGENVS
jgi:hypothetical protein